MNIHWIGYVKTRKCDTKNLHTMFHDVLGICLLDLSGKGSRDDTHQYRSVLYDEKVVKSISRIRGMTDVPVFEREARVKYFVTYNDISEQYK